MNTDFAAERRIRSHHLDSILDVLKRVPRVRWWSLTPEQLNMLAAIHASCAGHAKGSTTIPEVFTATVNAIAKVVPNLLTPELEEPKIPTPPRDALTNDILWLPKENQTERQLMRSRFPEWASYCEAREKTPVKQHVAMQDERNRIAQLKDFYQNYDDSKNVFKHGTQTERAKVAKSDPILAGLLQAEAKSPQDFGFNNYSTLGQIEKTSPLAAAVIQSAKQTQKNWEHLDAEEKAAEARQVIDAARKLGLTLAGDHSKYRRFSERKPLRQTNLPLIADAPLSAHESARAEALQKLVKE
jgi:hypothetical protein